MTQTAVATVPYATVPRLWPDSTVAIIGGGSSLTAADVEYCRDRAHVIAIKEAFQLGPWAEVMYGCDEKFWRWYKGVPEFRGLKYRLEPSPDQVEPFVDWPGVQILKNTGMEGLEGDPSGLRTGQNSGYQAINLAVHLGATRIVLLGFDMWRGPNGEQNWFGPHPIHVPSPYPIFLHMFSTIVEPLKAAGVEVVNASRFTVLSAFPRVALEDVL